ncbi:MAG: ABC transporter ATP-binding protein [Chromatiales bacterium]
MLKVDAIECRYGAETVFRDFSLSVSRGEIVSLLGPSGCGKTTALRAVAGFEPVHHGQIKLAGKTVSLPGYTCPPEKRHLGMVFQDYALFPHLNVYRNVTFGLRDRPRAERREAARRVLTEVGLQGLEDRYPHELSGGQQQRVALARALAPRPYLLLLDEPFSSLDVELREHLSVEVRDLLKAEGITGILVTHDQHEAFAISDNVGVMQQGRIVQWDTPYNLYHEPATRFVADFIGQGRFLEGTIVAPDAIDTEIGLLKGKRTHTDNLGTRVEVLIRPDDVVPDPEGPLSAMVVDRAFKGAEILYTLRLDTGSTLLSLFPSHNDHRVGDRVPFRLAADHLISFPLYR